MPPKQAKPEYPIRTSPRRIKRRRKDSKLTRRQVYAAYEVYKAGYSVPDLAARGWKQWGYKDARMAELGLYRAFEIEGLPRRPLSMIRTSSTCSACGVRADERTMGCKVCRVRHWRRKAKGLPYQPPHRTRTHCSGCGVPNEQRTRGCKQCINRHGRRKRQLLAEAQH